MGDTQSLEQCHLLLVEASEEHVVEVDGPDAIVDLFETDPFLIQDLAEEQRVLPESEGAGLADATSLEVAGVLGLRQVLGHVPGPYLPAA